MKRPWKNPLKPLLGCVALLTASATFIYANADHRKYYQSNHDGGLKNDCSFTNDDYAFTMIYCGNDWMETTLICNYYLPTQEQKQCVQVSATYSTCSSHDDDLELIHVCYL